MSAQTLHDWLMSLEPGKRYYKPNNVTWAELYYQIHQSQRYAGKFKNRRVHHMRGDMFALACTCCGGVER